MIPELKMINSRVLIMLFVLGKVTKDIEASYLISEFVKSYALP
jgi:hypothetical protein